MIDIEIGVLMRVRPESELEIRVLLPAVESFHQDFPKAEFVVWEFWRMAGRQSDYHYRGAPNEIDLGDII